MRHLTNDEKNLAIQQIESEGYAVIKTFLDADEVVKSLGIIGKAPKHESPNGSSKVVYGLATLNKWFLDMCDQESISEILMHFINDPYFGKIPDYLPNYIISYSLARTSTKALPTHIDSYVPNAGGFPIFMQAIIALENQTTENGNTYLVPKSHLFGEYPDQSNDHPDTVEIYSEAGDLVIWDSRIWHGARENISGGTRWAIINTYSRWWIKPRLDSTRAISNEFYTQISERQKALLGFCCIPPGDPNERIVTRIGLEELPTALPNI